MSTEPKAPGYPIVTAAFSDYVPPFEVEPMVRRMLDSVPEKYLTGLAEVVLTNASGLRRNLRRGVTRSRGRKVKIVTAGGLYHQEWQGKPAWIEIFVDNALKGWERGLWLRIPLAREGRIGDVLFHEIGHHIHSAIRPEFREREDVADVWMVRLSSNYTQKRHPLLRWSLSLVRPWMLMLRNRVMKRALKQGLISRAGYEETVGRPGTH